MPKCDRQSSRSNPVQDCGCHVLKWLKADPARIDGEQAETVVVTI